jgi:methylation protein EvaC
MEVYTCLICRGEVKPFISFGRMPIANAFLTPAQYEREHFFTLEAGICTKCSMVQLTQLVKPDLLFHADYAYFSSISTRMTQHFKEWADAVRATYLAKSDPFVIEIGSNDGIMLQNFAKAGVRHLGIEPSANVAAVAREKGINTRVCFFNQASGGEIAKEHGPADVVLGANVICHIPDLHAVALGLDALLKPKGVFIFQEPYLGDIITKTSYDQIYDEHVFYFSLHSLQKFFEGHQMEIVHVEPYDVHGGSMRYVVARKGARPVQDSVRHWWKHEESLKITDPMTYQGLKERIFKSRDDLTALLKTLKKQGKKISGYGATSKSTTVTNFCGIGPDLIDYISDTTPGKQGKFSPGVHIPVLPYEHFKQSKPDQALLFAWNHGAEILAKEKDYIRQGGRFIVYVPTVRAVEAL